MQLAVAGGSLLGTFLSEKVSISSISNIFFLLSRMKLTLGYMTLKFDV